MNIATLRMSRSASAAPRSPATVEKAVIFAQGLDPRQKWKTKSKGQQLFGAI